MADQEQRYGIWYIKDDRWGSVGMPEVLVKKYGQYSTRGLFFSMEECQLVWDFISPVDHQYFAMHPSTYQSDKIRRLAHAEKYL